jgi:phosphatidylinositol-3-phosphatase
MRLEARDRHRGPAAACRHGAGTRRRAAISPRRWLASQLPSLLRLPKTVVFVVFDEGATDDHGGGHVPALELGTAVRRGSRFTAATSHYGLLRTIEDAWRLPLLGRSARATPVTGIWR